MNVNQAQQAQQLGCRGQRSRSCEARQIWRSGGDVILDPFGLSSFSNQRKFCLGVISVAANQMLQKLGQILIKLCTVLGLRLQTNWLNVGVKVSRGRIGSWRKYIGCCLLYSASVTLQFRIFVFARIVPENMYSQRVCAVLHCGKVTVCVIRCLGVCSVLCGT